MDIGVAGSGPTDESRRLPVVVGVDGSPCSEAALRYAMTAAAQRGTDLEMVSCFALELYWVGGAPIQIPDTEAISADTENRARELVDKVRKELGLGSVVDISDVSVQVIAAAGPAAQLLTDRSAETQLLVVGNRGRGAVRSAVLGSVALHCVTHARCPVVVVHAMADEPTVPPRVVVGVDGSEPARAALAIAVEEAARTGATVEVVAAYVLADHWTDLYSVLIPTVEQIRADVRRGAEELVGSVLAEWSAEAVAPRVDVVVVEGRRRTCCYGRRMEPACSWSAAGEVTGCGVCCWVRWRCSARGTRRARSWSCPLRRSTHPHGREAEGQSPSSMGKVNDCPVGQVDHALVLDMDPVEVARGVEAS